MNDAILEKIQEQLSNLQEQVVDLRKHTDAQISDLHKQITDLREHTDARFDSMRNWMIGIAVAILLVVVSFGNYTVSVMNALVR